MGHGAGGSLGMPLLGMPLGGSHSIPPLIWGHTERARAFGHCCAHPPSLALALVPQSLLCPFTGSFHVCSSRARGGTKPGNEGELYKGEAQADGIGAVHERVVDHESAV